MYAYKAFPSYLKFTILYVITQLTDLYIFEVFGVAVRVSSETSSLGPG